MGLEYVLQGEQEDALIFLRQLLEQMIFEVGPEIQLEKLMKMSVIQQACFDTPDGSCNKCGYIPQPRKDNCNVLVISPGYKLVPRAVCPRYQKVPMAVCPGYNNVPRAVSPRY